MHNCTWHADLILLPKAWKLSRFRSIRWFLYHVSFVSIFGQLCSTARDSFARQMKCCFWCHIYFHLKLMCVPHTTDQHHRYSTTIRIEWKCELTRVLYPIVVNRAGLSLFVCVCVSLRFSIYLFCLTAFSAFANLLPAVAVSPTRCKMHSLRFYCVLFAISLVHSDEQPQCTYTSMWVSERLSLGLSEF